MKPMDTLNTSLAIASLFAVVFGSCADPLDYWQLRNPTLQGSYLSSVTHGNGSFVAVGLSGAILTSHDSAVWTNRTSANGFPSLVSLMATTGLLLWGPPLS